MILLAPGCTNVEPVAPYDRGYLAEEGMGWEADVATPNSRDMCIPAKKPLRAGPVRQGAGVVATRRPRSLLGKPSPLLRRIGQSLAVLPAYQSTPAAADAPPALTEVGLRYSRYSEDSLDADKLIFGSRDRYDIDITQLWIEGPIGASWSVALDVQNDYQTGASPGS